MTRRQAQVVNFAIYFFGMVVVALAVGAMVGEAVGLNDPHSRHPVAVGLLSAGAVGIVLGALAGVAAASATR